MAGSPDPVASTAYGITKALADSVAEFIGKVANREVSGSDDPAVIEAVKAERKVPEFELLKRFISDKGLRVQLQLGLALRKLQAKGGQAGSIESLRALLQRRFGTPGLHVAELASSGVVTSYLNLLISEQQTDADVATRLDGFLRNVDRYTLFVVTETPVAQTLEKVRARLIAGGQGTVAVFAKGQARTNLARMVKALQKDSEDYIIRSTASGDEETVFISLFEAWMGLDDIDPPKGLLTAAMRTRRPPPVPPRKRRNQPRRRR